MKSRILLNEKEWEEEKYNFYRLDFDKIFCLVMLGVIIFIGCF
jgi:hypothetical protein